MSERTINVAEYLFTRLVQLGCASLHGLPGDFNLLALDFVEPSGLRWVGNCNELNAGKYNGDHMVMTAALLIHHVAGYAADAYARLRGLGAIITTFGVGELSAINAIAGSFAELAPVVHIVGTPGRPSQKEGMLLHHTIHKEVTVAQANLLNTETAPSEIDRVLRTCYVESRPVYIQLPTDMVEQPVPARLLDTPIDVEICASDKDAEDLAVQLILERLYEAKYPIRSQVEALVKKSGIPVFVAPMGKGVINEDVPNFVGLYAGAVSRPDVAQAVEKSDLVITIGNIKSDLNTAGFTYRFSRLNSIDIHYDHINIKCAKIEKVYFKHLVPRLEQELDPSKLATTATQIPKIQRALGTQDISEGGKDIITHAYLWPRLSSFLRKGDILITETGTSYIGHWETELPRDVTIINQILWSSIGYGVGAAQGAALATQEMGHEQRVICFEGDGSFQLTAQELSTIIRHDLNVTMFLIENSGYEIERWIHGMEANYNDVPQWQYSKFPEALIPESSTHRVKTWKIRSRSELEALLGNQDFANGKGLQLHTANAILGQSQVLRKSNWVPYPACFLLSCLPPLFLSCLQYQPSAAMPNIILSINAGSSSVKVSIFSYANQQPKQLAVIQIAGLTAPPATLKYDRGDEHIKDQKLDNISSSEDAYEKILEHLISDKGLSELNSPDDIEFACHRVVHGGDYDRPTRIDRDTYHHLEELSDLAPLHNAGALNIVRAVHSKCPKASNVAFFDSAFHQTLPLEVRTYAIDPAVARRNKLRKYGFHGLSYSFITRVVATHLSKAASSLNIIALHLGSGASACAIQNGVSHDTTMGLTPLAGLPGATRSGDIDASLIFHFTHDAGKLSPASTKDMHITAAEDILNKKSGWAALTGTTDFGQISSRAQDGDEQCRLAFDLFVDRIVGYVGAYYARMGGAVDALVFAGGIGEKGAQLRQAVVARVRCLGFDLDDAKNGDLADDAVVVDVSASSARHRVLVCQTDEQEEMARQCVAQAEELRGKREGEH
nr:pyruvate decarboxylase [Quercus suber]